jgi:hypothetical protein
MYVALLVWVGIATLLSYVVDRLWSDFTCCRYFRYALAPGVVVHELSHLAACLLTGASVKRVVLFGPSGGGVEHSPPKMPLVGQPIISLAPIGGCTLALWFVWLTFAGSLGLEAVALPDVDLSVVGLAEVWQTLKTVYVDWFRWIFSRDFLSIRGAVFLYCVLTFSICMAPSRTDLRHAVTGLAAIGAIVFLVHRLGFDRWQIGHEISKTILAFGWKAFTFSIVLLVSALAVSVPAALAGKILGKAQ